MELSDNNNTECVSLVYNYNAQKVQSSDAKLHTIRGCSYSYTFLSKYSNFSIHCFHAAYIPCLVSELFLLLFSKYIILL